MAGIDGIKDELLRDTRELLWQIKAVALGGVSVLDGIKRDSTYEVLQVKEILRAICGLADGGACKIAEES